MRYSLAVAAFMGAMGGILGAACMQAVLTGSPAMAGPGTPTAGIVNAQEFRLVTQDGHVRAQLVLWDGQRPMLVLGDAYCKARVTLGLSELDGHPSLFFNDEDCRRRATLDLIPDGLPELTFRDETDVPRARLHLLKDGSPVLRLFDPHGVPLWTAAR